MPDPLAGDLAQRAAGMLLLGVGAGSAQNNSLTPAEKGNLQASDSNGGPLDVRVPKALVEEIGND
jgi:hypothetical protein